ncbi:MAG: GntR family transcriptional regulator [Actinomycetota bacterium]|nr:GntR family transcriptional regulator [Actinomycetota bacterium]
MDLQQVKDRVYFRLREDLISQEIPPGEALKEIPLSERFGVSKTPIREALARLESDGLVEIIPYRGARAKWYSAKDFEQLYEARFVIQAECLQRITEDPRSAIAEQLLGNVRRSEELLAAEEYEELSDEIDRFDEIIFSAIDNDVLREVIDRIATHFRRIGRHSMTPAKYVTSVREHAEIVKAARDGNQRRARERLARHSDHTKADLLASLEPNAVRQKR